MRLNLKAVEERVAPLGSRESYDREFIFDLLLAYGKPQGNVTRLRKGSLNVADDPETEVAQKNVVYFKETTADPLAVIDELKTSPTVVRYTSMIHRGVLWCDLRLVEPQDGWILAVGVLIRPGCPGGCRFHCGGLLVLSVGRWFGGYWGQPGWRDQMRVQALTRSSAQAQSSGSFKIW